MINCNIVKLDFKNIPYDLLLLADPSRKAIDDYIKRGFAYVCIKDKIIGIYVLLQTRSNTIELINIAVEESYHSKGVGKKLLCHAIETAKELGAKILDVGTGNSSISQLYFYQKSGFRIVGVDKDYFVKNYEEDIYENNIKCVDMIRLSLEL